MGLWPKFHPTRLAALVALSVLAGCSSPPEPPPAPAPAPPPPPPPPEAKLLHEYKTPASRNLAVAVSQDGKVAATGGYGSDAIAIWDLTTGENTMRLEGHTGPVTGLAFVPSSDEKFLLLSSSRDRTLRLWDMQTGKTVRTFRGHKWPVLGMSVSPDGKKALSVSDHIHEWDLETGKEIRQHQGHGKTVWTARYSPDGTRILSGSWDETIGLWDAKTGKKIFQQGGHEDRVRSAEFLGQEAAVGVSAATGGGTIYVWDLDNGNKLFTLKGHTEGVASLAPHPSGQWLLSGSGVIRDNGTFDPKQADTTRLWDMTEQEEILSFPGHGAYTSAIAWLPDGQRAVTVGGDNMLRIWELPVNE